MRLRRRRPVRAPNSDGTTRLGPINFHTSRPRPVGSKAGGWDYAKKNGAVRVIRQARPLEEKT